MTLAVNRMDLTVIRQEELITDELARETEGTLVCDQALKRLPTEHPITSGLFPTKKGPFALCKIDTDETESAGSGERDIYAARARELTTS